MQRISIIPENFNVNIFNLLNKQWMLLTTGAFKKDEYNCMTIAWGAFGIMWHKPIVMVVVRPSRYSFKLIEKYDTFAVCGFTENYRDALLKCGSKSGANVNKFDIANLTAEAANTIAAPIISEAELIMECKKIYFNDLVSANFLLPEIENNYNGSDYHRLYFGEVLHIEGVKKYNATN